MPDQKPPRTLTEEETSLLLTALSGPRYQLIALLMLDAGLRVSEAVSLACSDLYHTNEVVQMLSVITLKQKKPESRLIPLTQRLKSAIAAYVKVWEWRFESTPGKYAFMGDAKDSHVTPRQIERVIQAAGLKSILRKITPHMLRHTFATRLMRTTNIRIVQQLLGHKHISSTQIYLHPNADDLKKAVDSLNGS